VVASAMTNKNTIRWVEQIKIIDVPADYAGNFVRVDNDGGNTEFTMKSQDAKKNTKKAPQKTKAEKKLAKQAKKAGQK
jgi:hypothetical protein